MKINLTKSSSRHFTRCSPCGFAVAQLYHKANIAQNATELGVSETGEIEALNLGLASFFVEVSGNPQEFLGLEPLMQLHNENKALEPGQVIHVYPPFCTKQPSDGVSLKPVDVIEAHNYLAKLSSQIGSMADGEVIKFQVE